jgi:hypothetical protein
MLRKGDELSVDAARPTTLKLMLREKGAADYRPCGLIEMPALPPRGAVVGIARAEGLLDAVVEAVFIPPGCEEHCIATVFVAAC